MKGLSWKQGARKHGRFCEMQSPIVSVEKQTRRLARKSRKRGAPVKRVVRMLDCQREVDKDGRVREPTRVVCSTHEY